MTMRKYILGVCLVVLVSGDLWSRGIEVPSALVVIPARQRVVEFGFDLIRRQGVTLVAYQQDGADLLLHFWNGREWVALTPAVYFSGNFLLGAPEQVILIGSDTVLPAMFQTVPDWCRKTARIRSFEVATLVNECGALLNFDVRQWQWFAEKYGLSLTDLNSDRRRWGKYGEPGNEWYRHQSPGTGSVPVVTAPLPPVASSEATPTISPVQVIPDNVPIQSATPAEAIPPAPAPVVVPAPEAITAVPTLPPTIVVPASPAQDVLPPGTSVELPVK